MIQHCPAVLELGEQFYDRVQAALFPQGQLRYRNLSAFQQIGLENIDDEEIKKHFWQFLPWTGNLAAPLALRYHGHQFRHYNPDLGDGRGFLFAQFLDNKGRLLDIGTKGSGTTPYSRQGDGRLTLKGAVREALATELLESLGVNTSKTFVIYETGEALERSDEPSPTRSAVLSRLSHSHIRFGTFQRLAYLQQDFEILRLVDYSLKYYFPESAKVLKNPSPEEKIEFLFQQVTEASADLIASVMMSGFVHGVLNTDNMNITGELFDYGPYRFLPHYDPSFTAAYFDHRGLYAYGRQPTTFLWNLNQLQKSLKTAAPEAHLQDILETFPLLLNKAVLHHFQKRMNLQGPASEVTGWLEEFFSLFFDFLETEKALFEQSFFDLHSGYKKNRLSRSPQAKLYEKESFRPLQQHLKQARPLRAEKESFAYFQRHEPETLLIDEIEKIWSLIDQNDDWTLFNEKILRLRSFRDHY